MSRPIKHGGKLFMTDGRQIVLGKFIGGLFYMEVQSLDQLPMKGYTLDDKALTSQQNYGIIYC